MSEQEMKHVAVTVSARQATKILRARERLNDLIEFVADGGNLPNGSKFLAVQDNKVIFAVPEEPDAG